MFVDVKASTFLMMFLFKISWHRSQQGTRSQKNYRLRYPTKISVEQQQMDLQKFVSEECC
jgi:hypothetical protein